MDQSKRLEIALTILGWTREKYEISNKYDALKQDVADEISRRMITISTGEGNPIPKNEQWAYGVLLSL